LVVHKSLVNVLDPLCADPLPNEFLREKSVFVQFHHDCWQKLPVLFVLPVHIQKQVFQIQQSFQLSVYYHQPA
jgi:hypothetical protein